MCGVVYLKVCDCFKNIECNAASKGLRQVQILMILRLSCCHLQQFWLPGHFAFFRLSFCTGLLKVDCPTPGWLAVFFFSVWAVTDSGSKPKYWWQQHSEDMPLSAIEQDAHCSVGLYCPSTAAPPNVLAWPSWAGHLDDEVESLFEFEWFSWSYKLNSLILAYSFSLKLHSLQGANGTDVRSGLDDFCKSG